MVCHRTDPGFRDGFNLNSVWGGLLGPGNNWVFGILFAVWLRRRDTANLGTLVLAAAAVSNGLIRAMPMGGVLKDFLLRSFSFEDEVFWGIWAFVRVERTDLKNLGLFQVAERYFMISVWILSVSYKSILRIWKSEFYSRRSLVLFCALPVALYFAKMPLQFWLDRNFRIDW